MGTGLGCGQALGGLSLTLGIGEVGTERVGHRGWGQMRPRGSQETQGAVVCPLSALAQGCAVLGAGGQWKPWTAWGWQGPDQP